MDRDAMHALSMHPSARSDAVRRLEAGLRREPSGALRFRYRLEGELRRLRLAEPGAAQRRDGLWQHSCFEAFLGRDDGDGYLEFNFSPGGDWACYSFSGRRRGRGTPAIEAPAITVERGDGLLSLEAVLAPGAMPALLRAGALRAGLAAVIEDARGARSYWALAHTGAAPDFHDPAAFTLVTEPR